MPTLLPRESMNATSAIPTSFQRPSPSDHRVGFSSSFEATHRFTCVTACSLAVWKLTTPCYHDAASSCYRGARTTPQTGLQPARLTAVTANGQHRFNSRCCQTTTDRFMSGNTLVGTRFYWAIAADRQASVHRAENLRSYKTRPITGSKQR